MKSSLHTLSLVSCLLLFALPVRAGHWVDSLSFSFGEDLDGNETTLLRAGVQNRWDRTWFNGGAWHVGAYWDAELAYLDSDVSDAKNNDLLDLSLTPMFRMQRDTTLSSGVAPFAEAGIGAHLLTDTTLGDRDFSTSLQFSPVLGVGLGFGDDGRYEVSYRYQRLTNLGIKTPNDGLDLHMLRIGYLFEGRSNAVTRGSQ